MSDTVLRHELLRADLASWLKKQPTTWWSVDGEPALMGKLDFPCSADEIAEALRNSEVDLCLHVFDGSEQPDSADETLTRVAEAGKDTSGNRSLSLSWANSESLWLLVEDLEAAEEETFPSADQTD